MTVNQIQHQYAVGILTNHLAVQQAIQALEKADFPLQQVSIIAKQFLGTNHSQKQIDSSNYASPRYSAVRRRNGAYKGAGRINPGGFLQGQPLVNQIHATAPRLLGLRQGANKGALTGLVLGSITGILDSINHFSY